MLYSLAIYLYMLGIIFVSPFHRKARAMVKGRIDTFRILRRQIDPQARYVWFHAASLGEFEQGRPLMERFRRQHPEFKILLTFFSPSGYEVRKNYPGADVICYLPLDTPGNVLSFFRLVRPEMAFFIKYEFWLNFIIACHHRRIPVYSVSSIFRKNKVFFRWYGWGYAHVLKLVTHFFVQDEESARLLATRGIRNNVTIVGDTRFDRVIDIAHQAKPLPLVEQFVADAPMVLVAGSSWPPDEDIIIPYFNSHSEMKLILAPHVIDEDHLRQIESKLRRPCLRYTEANEDNVRQADCLIVNCFGLLSSIYRYGHVACVGGGFGAGLHNVPEAAVYGIPVLIGPNNKGFREAQDLLRLGGCFEITGQTLFNAAMDHALRSEELRHSRGRICKSYIESNAGATDVIFRVLGL
ncbi:MAG: 3-deoxy-D-manno-octulosonic acid transferase [Bacteroidaceae bacterium]|nr:3-deoxy-D-manno-octulosonic acid transferase [Bacteroidaceae bacterium]